MTKLKFINKVGGCSYIVHTSQRHPRGVACGVTPTALTQVGGLIYYLCEEHQYLALDMGLDKKKFLKRLRRK